MTAGLACVPRNGAGDIDRQRHGESPGDAHAPVGVLVRARVIKDVHRRDRVSEGQDDERGKTFGDEFTATHAPEFGGARGRIDGRNFLFLCHRFPPQAPRLAEKSVPIKCAPSGPPGLRHSSRARAGHARVGVPGQRSRAEPIKCGDSSQRSAAHARVRPARWKLQHHPDRCCQGPRGSPQSSTSPRSARPPAQSACRSQSG